MEWQEVASSWTLVPSQPTGIIHFLGGAFVGSAPQLVYRWLLEQLAKDGYAIVATPFANGFEHKQIARQALSRFETTLQRLQSTPALSGQYLPVYGLGHSMGCKIQVLIGSLYGADRAGNILMAYNNYPARRAIPLLEQLDFTPPGTIEFSPSPAATLAIAASDYNIPRTLLVRFQKDDIDQSSELLPVLQERLPGRASVIVLPGNHNTPCSQDFDWQAGVSFTPVDAIAQWVKQELSRDLKRLKRELLRWLNPVGMPSG
ncbi:protein of unknown function (DUF1350) [Rubidibacter lacunae KORDI 51-2]|uniref:DUF1350 domain-containing protein n=1 Tax=Rubidibacter lacunae KORDI 51-2 TaxID=582515 RepID=U5DER7_9CHRO|nr:DUF1350 family protein [Rubidibacter lacunae]ERN39787.1 protein of unknown function (DUF1350) [Rubidibacter lacunae KORDI 51-2]